ncbi:sulfotransferase domain-containing protein [Mangrovimonas sp. TPBH4]|uniref:sulfotransferase domain-containing protein n=1 Tax=Mangrovimonas sp. TPBH4 TaxID=1645914 RepID=UPI0006B4E19D|nr:sulfotransferase domain-containing protein [Mangrovimonas sp. TPBH4]
MKDFKWKNRKERLRNIAISKLYSYYPFRYKRTVWLIGAGRSGTTWIASLINIDASFRELFEPFHSCYYELKDVGFYHHKYLNKQSLNIELRQLAKKIFQGAFYQKRSDEGNDLIWNTRYENILVKDVFSNLMAFEVYRENRQIKPILLIRNPFEVALSLQRTKDWNWMKDPIDFLEQKDLVTDFLKPYECLIRKVSKEGTFIDKQILIWAIINYIPLKQFDENVLLVTFYEHWIANPDTELKRIYEHINLVEKEFVNLKQVKKFKVPSKTSINNTFKTASWRDKFSKEQLESGEFILNSFGFKNLYNEQGIPNIGVLNNILNKSK